MAYLSCLPKGVKWGVYLPGAASGRQLAAFFESGIETRRASREVNVKHCPFPNFGMGVESAARFFEEAQDDAEAQPGSVAARFGGEVRFEDLRHHLGRYARPVILHGKHEQWSEVAKAFAVDKSILGSILKMSQVQRRFEQLPANFHLVLLRRALKSINRQVQQNLDQVGAVDRHRNVLV